MVVVHSQVVVRCVRGCVRAGVRVRPLLGLGPRGPLPGLLGPFPTCPPPSPSNLTGEEREGHSFCWAETPFQ